MFKTVDRYHYSCILNAASFKVADVERKGRAYYVYGSEKNEFYFVHTDVEIFVGDSLFKEENTYCVNISRQTDNSVVQICDRTFFGGILAAYSRRFK